MPEVHDFAFGWVNPVLSVVMAFLGSLLGLVLTPRAGQSSGAARAGWLTLAAVALGGTGVWLMHFLAMIGFDVPATVVRYDLSITLLSLAIAVLSVGLGLFIVGTGRPALWKILPAGVSTGLGIAATQYTGFAAMRIGGVVSFDRHTFGLVTIASVVVATAVLWFARTGGGVGATAGTAVLTAAALWGTHYAGMSAIRVRLTTDAVRVDGVSPVLLLIPVSLLACVVIAALAYATVGFGVRRENQRETELLDHARLLHQAAAMPRQRLASRHH